MAGNEITIDNGRILEAAGYYEELAGSYDDVAEAIGIAGSLRDHAFGDPFRAAFDDLFVFLYNCAYEGAANLRAYSR